MVNFCCAYNCSNTSDKNPDLIFHLYVLKFKIQTMLKFYDSSTCIIYSPYYTYTYSFPTEKNKECKQKWIIAVCRKNFNPKESSRLCSAHFKPTDYNPPVICGPPHLKKDAVPSVFDFPDHLLPEKVCERLVTIRKVSDEPEELNLNVSLYSFIYVCNEFSAK